MKALIDGIVSIVKVVIILYAVFYAFESGMVKYVVSLFK